MAHSGDFREELYYRLDVVTVVVPPLRERVAKTFRCSSIGSSASSRPKPVAIHRAVVLSRGTMITTSDLPTHLAGLTSEPDQGNATFVERVGQFERKLIAEALAQSGGVQTQAARALGMSERHLRYKLKKYSLEGL